jgi:hypothetical protein
VDHIRFRLDPWRPSLFALLDRAVPESRIIGTLLGTVVSGSAP